MNLSKPGDDLVIRTVGDSDLEITRRTIAEAFLDEPLIVRGKVPLEVLMKFVLYASDTMASDGLSVIALPRDSDKSCGAIFSFDSAHTPSEELMDYVGKDEMLSKILGLLGHVEDQFFKHLGYERQTFPTGHSVHLLMIATNSEFRNMGISHKLLAAALELYRSKNYRYCVAECTSDYSQKTFQRAGFETWMTLNYADWFPSDSLFSPGKDMKHTTVKLMVKKLN